MKDFHQGKALIRVISKRLRSSNRIRICGSVGRLAGTGSYQAIEGFHDGGQEAGGDGDEAQEGAILEVAAQVELYPGGLGEYKRNEDDGEVDRVVDHSHDLVEAEHEHGGDGSRRGHPVVTLVSGACMGSPVSNFHSAVEVSTSNSRPQASSFAVARAASLFVRLRVLQLALLLREKETRSSLRA